MNNRTMIFATGIFLGYGIITLKKGIVSRKAGDIALGAICLLCGIALAAMMIGARNR